MVLFALLSPIYVTFSQNRHFAYFGDVWITEKYFSKSDDDFTADSYKIVMNVHNDKATGPFRKIKNVANLNRREVSGVYYLLVNATAVNSAARSKLPISPWQRDDCMNLKRRRRD